MVLAAEGFEPADGTASPTLKDSPGLREGKGEYFRGTTSPARAVEHRRAFLEMAANESFRAIGGERLGSEHLEEDCLRQGAQMRRGPVAEGPQQALKLGAQGRPTLAGADSIPSLCARGRPAQRRWGAGKRPGTPDSGGVGELLHGTEMGTTRAKSVRKELRQRMTRAEVHMVEASLPGPAYQGLWFRASIRWQAVSRTSVVAVIAGRQKWDGGIHGIPSRPGMTARTKLEGPGSAWSVHQRARSRRAWSRSGEELVGVGGPPDREGG